VTSAPTRAAVPAGRTLSPARRIQNMVMGGLILLATLLVVAPLILIFFYLIREGLGAINVDFFTKVPAPEGETGGGLANAILGSVQMLATR
jgi:phosphate transport system permease protein